MKLKILNLLSPEIDKNLVESIYLQCLESYTPVAKKNNYDILPDHIYANHFALALIGVDGLIGFSLLRVQHILLLDQLKMAYFKGISDETKDYIKSKCNNLLSIEWVTVSEKYRGKFQKFQPADLVIGLSLMFAANSEYDGAIGLSRMDIGAERISPRYGATQLGIIQRNNIDTAIMFMPKENFKLPEHKGLQNKILELWNEAINSQTIRKAA